MIFALVIKIALDAVYKRVAVAAFVLVDYHSDGLIHKQNIFVLVYNVYLIAYTRKIIGVRLCFRNQHFIGDKQLYYVVFRNMSVRLAFLAV